MFNGLESVGNTSYLNDTEEESNIRMEEEDNPQGDKEGSVARAKRSDTSMSELLTRIEDLENRIPPLKPPDSNDTQMQFLPITATIEQVVSAVNELIKRN